MGGSYEVCGWQSGQGVMVAWWCTLSSWCLLSPGDVLQVTRRHVAVPSALSAPAVAVGGVPQSAAGLLAGGAASAGQRVAGTIPR